MSIISLIILSLLLSLRLDHFSPFRRAQSVASRQEGVNKTASERALGHVQLEDGGERISGRAVEQTAKCRLAASRRVPSEFHYAHKPHGQFQAMPLVHLKWQHEHIADLDVAFEVIPMRISASILILRREIQFSSSLAK